MEMTKQRSYSPVEYVIKDISRVTHDTKRFIFELPLDTMLDFLPGDHLHMHYLFDGEEIERPYTPSSTPDDNGFFEMIIKRYPTGIMSGYVHGLKIGDKVRLSGPFAGGHYQLGMPMKVGMVAGGAGITPMISIIRTALRRNYDINISLVFANKTENDIILRSEFETLAAAHGNFKVLFALDQPKHLLNGFLRYSLARHYPLLHPS